MPAMQKPLFVSSQYIRSSPFCKGPSFVPSGKGIRFFPEKDLHLPQERSIVPEQGPDTEEKTWKT